MSVMFFTINFWTWLDFMWTIYFIVFKFSGRICACAHCYEGWKGSGKDSRASRYWQAQTVC